MFRLVRIVCVQECQQDLIVPYYLEELLLLHRFRGMELCSAQIFERTRKGIEELALSANILEKLSFANSGRQLKFEETLFPNGLYIEAWEG